MTGQKVEPLKRELARRLRREMTPAERILWQQLRASRLNGLHFRRQHVIHGFVADFYCHAVGVVVEVDGPVHDEQAEYDAARDLAFQALGLLTLRFRNEEVENDTAGVLVRIFAACAARITTHSHPESHAPVFLPSLQGGAGGGFRGHT